jgi:hypothetical protein
MDLFGIKKRRNIKNCQNEFNLAIGASLERFGTASAEHFIAMSELERISKFKLNENPEVAKNNTIQQAGFSAEVKRTARTNADNIIDGKTGRIARTDDVGSVNHTQYDHVDVDSAGNPLVNSDGNFIGGSQQKSFSKIKNYDTLCNKEFTHYDGITIDVPSDQLSDIVARWDKEITNLNQQKTALMANGELDKVKVIDEKITKIASVKSRLRDSGVSYDDGIEARESPTLSTMKDIGRVSHKAGVESAKMGAAFGSSISTITNTKAYINGDKQATEAVVQVLKDTGTASAKAYATGASSAAIGGALKASSSQICQNLAKKSGPTAILQTGIILAKQTTMLASGKINASQFIEGIGQEGMTLASSMTGGNLGAIVGTMVLPGVGTIVGGAVGGMVTSLLSGALYQELKCSINDTKISDEKRQVIANLCADLIEQEKQYREESLIIFNSFFNEKEAEIKEGFELMSKSIHNGESINEGLAIFGNAFDLKLEFETADDFKRHLHQGETLRL